MTEDDVNICALIDSHVYLFNMVLGNSKYGECHLVKCHSYFIIFPVGHASKSVVSYSLATLALLYLVLNLKHTENQLKSCPLQSKNQKNCTKTPLGQQELANRKKKT